MPRVLTDFNDVDDSGIVTALLSHVEGQWNVVVGNHVLLYDDGEHEAWGEIKRIEGDLLRAELDWETWGPAGRYQVRAQPNEAGAYVGMLYDQLIPMAHGTARIVTTLVSGAINSPTIPSAPVVATTIPLLAGLEPG